MTTIPICLSSPDSTAHAKARHEGGQLINLHSEKGY